MIIIFDKYTENVKMWKETIRCIGIETKIIVLEDDGSLPCEVISPYQYFISRGNAEAHTKRELHYNFIKIPEFWEIRAEGVNGAIYDMGYKKASIYFTEPIEKRNVQRVEWCMENGWIYKVDIYNKYGLKYISEFHDTDGKIESRVFYSDRNQEIIIEQPQSDTIILLKDGKVEAYFTSYMQFIEHFLTLAGQEEKWILFIQDDKKLDFLNLNLPGNAMWKFVLFSSNALLDQYLDRGGKDGYRFYAVPTNYSINSADGEVLILTASDQIAGIEYFVNELPDIKFHIAANTQVSDKLNRLAEKGNVEVYPQINSQHLNILWNKCNFYFDINYYWEIYDAVNVAHQKNLLILGFENTIHNRELVIPECVFGEKDYDKVIRKMKYLENNPQMVNKLLKKQQGLKLKIWEKLRESVEG